jgi:streptogramin lyase
VTRIDSETGEIAATIELDIGGEPLFLAAADDGLWVLGLTSLLRIDPATNDVDAAGPISLGRPPGPEPYVLGGLVIAEGAAWIADTYGSAVVRVATR